MHTHAHTHMIIHTVMKERAESQQIEDDIKKSKMEVNTSPLLPLLHSLMHFQVCEKRDRERQSSRETETEVKAGPERQRGRDGGTEGRRESNGRERGREGGTEGKKRAGTRERERL